MQLDGTNQVCIFTGRVTENLTRKIVEKLGTSLAKSVVFQYADGEFQPSFEESVRGKKVFIVQSTIPPADNLFELLMMVDAARRASAGQVIAVIPYYGFARQDRKDKPHVPITSRLVADMLEVAGVDRVVVMDLHADQIQGFFTSLWTTCSARRCSCLTSAVSTSPTATCFSPRPTSAARVVPACTPRR